MTALDDAEALTAELRERLAVVDRALDRLGDLINQGGGVEATLAIDEMAATLDEELAALTRQVAEHERDDFSSARTAVAIRRDRFGFLRAAVEAARVEAPSAHMVATPGAGAEAALDAALTGPGTGRRPVRSGPAGSIGRVLSVTGLVLLAFFLYQVTVSGVVHRRHQQLLLDQFEADAPEQAYYPTAGTTGTDGEEAAPDGLLSAEEAAGEAVDEGPTIVPAAEAPAPGTPVAILQIPRLDVEEVVVQGTSSAQLRQGPGHLRGTPMPGEPGNVAIAGARIANGGPFRDLDDLEEGDRIDATSAVGRFEYRVRSVERISEGEPDPARATGEGNILTLVTSAPVLLASERLAVVAELRSAPVPPRYRTVAPANTETGLDTTAGGFGPVAGWGAVLAVAVLAARRLYRLWARPVAYLVSTPILLALLILVFESVAGVLPATF